MSQMKTNAARVAASDVTRPKPARFTSFGRRVSNAPGSRTGGGQSDASDPIAGGLGEAIEAKKRDNLVLGETLVSFGLLQRHEMSEVQSAQARSSDVVGSLMVASAIRTRLGDILLHAKRVSSAQLELALEMQRQRGGLLGEILVRTGALDRGTLDAALALQGGRKLEG